MPQVGGGFLGLPLETERRNETTLLVHEIDKRGVIHAVVAALRRNLLGVDAIRLFRCIDGRPVACRAAQMWIEARQVVLHHGRRVALGIDRDEKGTRAIRILAERAQNL